MEHRYYPRIQIALEVDIFKRDKRLGQAYTKDISLGGMLIQSRCPGLSRNDVITLKVCLGGTEQMVRCLVVHTSLQNVGVMLIDMRKDSTYAIFDYLKKKEVPLRETFEKFG